MKKTIVLLLLLSACIGSYAQGYYITTIAGNGTSGYSGDTYPVTTAEFGSTYGIVYDASGNYYFSDADNHVIRKVNTSGVISTYAGDGTAGFSGDTGPATHAQLNTPFGLAVDGTGNLYIADLNNHRVRMVNPSGVITTVAGTGTSGYTNDGLAANTAALSFPKGVAIDGGNLYISDAGNHVIRMVDGFGIITTIAGTGTSGNSGNGGPAISATFKDPCGLAFDGTGNLFIADAMNNDIRKITMSSGSVSLVAGNGSVGSSGDGGAATGAAIGRSTGIAFDPAGNLYSCNLNTYTIRKINTSGIISTFAGNSSYGYSGDGGLATAAKIGTPYFITTDNNGNLAISDNTNYRIRRISFDNPPSFAAGTSQTLSVCQNAATVDINSQLAVIDLDASQLLEWTLTSVPTHGSVAGSPSSASSTGSSTIGVAPSGFTYTPTTGYTGTDAFTVQISDGITTTLTVVNVIVNSLPTISSSSVTICNGLSTTLTATGGATYTWSPGTGLSATTGSSIAANPTVTTTYTITGANSSGCSNIGTSTVTVNNVPAVAAISGSSTTLCAGSNMTLTDAISGGTWTSSIPAAATVNSSGMVHGVAGGTTDISYAVTNSCGTNTVSYAVTVNPLPNAGVIAAQRICRTTPITLTSTGDAGGTWSTSAPSVVTVNAATGEITGYNTSASGTVGTAVITYSVTNGCGTQSDTALITVKAPPLRSGGSTSPCVGVPDAISFTPSGGTIVSSDPSITTISGSTATITAVTAPATTTLTYTFVPGNATSCGSVTEAFTSVPFGANTITGPNTVRLGSTITLSASNSIWNTTPASSSVGFLVSGSYAGTASGVTVTVTASATASIGDVAIIKAVRTTSCKSSDTQSITIICPTCKPAGEEETQIADFSNVSIYPNPGTGKFTISLSSGSLSSAITIADLTGKVIATKITAKDNADFDLSGYPRGMYIISITAGEKKYREKVLIE